MKESQSSNGGNTLKTHEEIDFENHIDKRALA